MWLFVDLRQNLSALLTCISINLRTFCLNHFSPKWLILANQCMQCPFSMFLHLQEYVKGGRGGGVASRCPSLPKPNVLHSSIIYGDFKVNYSKFGSPQQDPLTCRLIFINSLFIIYYDFFHDIYTMIFNIDGNLKKKCGHHEKSWS